MAQAPTSRSIFKELGASGLNIQAGLSFEEFRSELKGIDGVKIYTEMSMNSAVLGAILFTIEQMLQQVEWKIEPFSEDNADQPPKQFIEECKDDMSMSWPDTLSEIITFLTYGWSFHEICYKLRRGPQPPPIKVDGRTLGAPASKFNDGKIGWRKWPLRGQNTLLEWVGWDDPDAERAMTQQLSYPHYMQVTIPLSKALLFRTSVEKDNPEGRSLLRRAYRSWYYAKRFEEIEAVGVERDLQGLPVLTPPEGLNLWDDQDAQMVQALTAATKLVQGVRRGNKEGVVKPFGWVLELLSAGGRRQFDLNATIQRYETRMAMTCLADFIFLGQGKTGSWALSSDKTDMFILALGGFLRRIKEVVNRHAIPDLLRLNGMDDSRPPRLEHGDIETQNLTELANYIKALTEIGAVSFPDEGLERYLRTAADLPEPPEDGEIPEEPVEPPEPEDLTAAKRRWLRKSMGELSEIYRTAKQNGHGSV